MVMRPRSRVLYGTYEAEPDAGDDALVVPAVDEHEPLSATFRSGGSQIVSAGDGKNAEPLDSIMDRSRSKTQEKYKAQGTQTAGPCVFVLILCEMTFKNGAEVVTLLTYSTPYTLYQYLGVEGINEIDEMTGWAKGPVVLVYCYEDRLGMEMRGLLIRYKRRD